MVISLLFKAYSRSYFIGYSLLRLKTGKQATAKTPPFGTYRVGTKINRRNHIRLFCSPTRWILIAIYYDNQIICISLHSLDIVSYELSQFLSITKNIKACLLYFFIVGKINNYWGFTNPTGLRGLSKSFGELTAKWRIATKARVIKMLVCIAILLRSTLDSITTPCSVKTNGMADFGRLRPDVITNHLV